jgi:[ribosomal protein S5]-alanine N-acetyltransferase
MVVPSIRTSRLELISCGPAFMRAALQGMPMPVDYQLPSDFPGDLTGLMQRRLVQLERNPLEQPYLVRSLVFDEQMIGYVGFHAMPDFRGRLEVGYTIFSSFRRQGFAFEAVDGLFDWARLEPGVNTFVASVRPTNVASLAVIAKFGFVQIGRQWDEEDGEELVFELLA